MNVRNKNRQFRITIMILLIQVFRVLTDTGVSGTAILISSLFCRDKQHALPKIPSLGGVARSPWNNGFIEAGKAATLILGAPWQLRGLYHSKRQPAPGSAFCQVAWERLGNTV